MLARSWPGPSTVAWQRDGHIRSLQSSGGGAWWHGWGPCRISRTLTPSQPGWPLLEGRAPQVCSGTLSGMLGEGNVPRDLLTAWHYTEHGERAGSRTNTWCGGEVAWRCHSVCEHGVWEKPKEVSSPSRGSYQIQKTHLKRAIAAKHRGDVKVTKAILQAQDHHSHNKLLRNLENVDLKK